MSKRTLTVHIGSHKTGTTSIQHVLEHNAEALADHGMTFFHEDRWSRRRLRPRLHSWLSFVDPEEFLPSGMHIADPDLLAERLAEADGDVVVSSENLSFIFDDDNLASLRRSLADAFDDIRVICYLRRQDRHLVSHHQEGAKPHRRAEHALFGSAPRALPEWTPAHDLYLDYDRRLGSWADVFGEDSVTLRVYERDRLRHGDAVADFFHLIGVPDHEPVPDSNSSVGLVAGKIGHLVHGAGLSDPDAVAVLLMRGAPESPKMLPSRSEAEACLARYAESNRALNRRFRITEGDDPFSADFDDYPDEPRELWSEETANAAVAHLARRIDEALMPGVTPDDLRDAAIAIGEKDPAAAVRLLRVAHARRPNGPVIRAKLAEFEAAAARR